MPPVSSVNPGAGCTATSATTHLPAGGSAYKQYATSRLCFQGDAASLTGPVRDYLLSASPFAAQQAGVHALTSPIAAAPVCSPTQQGHCDRLLDEAMASGQGIFQFVSPAAHHNLPSRDVPLADYLLWRLALTPHQGCQVGRYTVTRLDITHHDEGRKAYTAFCKDRAGREFSIPITQIGLSYKAQFFDVDQLAQVHAYYQEHIGLRTDSCQQPVDFTSGSSSAPTLVSFGGFGRNAALLGCIEGLAQLKQAQRSLSDGDVSHLLDQIRGQGRRQHDARFLQNAKQFDAVVEFLKQQQSNHRTRPHCASDADAAPQAASGGLDKNLRPTGRARRPALHDVVAPEPLAGAPRTVAKRLRPAAGRSPYSRSASTESLESTVSGPKLRQQYSDWRPAALGWRTALLSRSVEGLSDPLPYRTVHQKLRDITNQSELGLMVCGSSDTALLDQFLIPVNLIEPDKNKPVAGSIRFLVAMRLLECALGYDKDQSQRQGLNKVDDKEASLTMLVRAMRYLHAFIKPEPSASPEPERQEPKKASGYSSFLKKIFPFVGTKKHV